MATDAGVAKECREAVELIDSVHESVLTAGYVKDWSENTGEVRLSRVGGRSGPPDDKAIMNHVFLLLGYDGSDLSCWFPAAAVLSIYKRLGLIMVEYSLGSADKVRQFLAEKETSARRARVSAAKAAVRAAEKRLREVRAEVPEDLPDKPTTKEREEHGDGD